MYRHTVATSDALTSVGFHPNFADAWLHCLDIVINRGTDVADGDLRIRELLNVSLAARSCRPTNLISAGANARRIALMERKYSDLEPVPPYEISYGALFRCHQGVDQIRHVAAKLRSKRETKQATMAFQSPTDINLPCLSLLDFKIRGGELHTNAVYRSQNVYASQPGNAVAIRSIQREIAQLIDVPIGLLVFHVLSAHIYLDDLDSVQSLLDGQTRSHSKNSEGA